MTVVVGQGIPNVPLQRIFLEKSARVNHEVSRLSFVTVVRRTRKTFYALYYLFIYKAQIDHYTCMRVTKTILFALVNKIY